MAKILEPTKNYDDMIPVSEWDGDCWQTFFEQFCVPNGEANGVSPWEYLANFVKTIRDLDKYESPGKTKTIGKFVYKEEEQT